jgi:hypothetical protein
MEYKDDTTPKRYSDKVIQQMQSDIKEIKESLIGTLEKQGFIAKMLERVNKIEDKQTIQWWFIAMITIIVITGSMKVFFA